MIVVCLLHIFLFSIYFMFFLVVAWSGVDTTRKLQSFALTLFKYITFFMD